MTTFKPKSSDHQATEAEAPPDALPEIAVKTLPSGFKPYPKGAKIIYVPYTFGELVKFNQSKLPAMERMEQILSGIYCTGFDKHGLTFSDYLFIGLLRRISTFGSNRFVIRYKCPACSKQNEVYMQESEIEFDDLSAPELPVVATLSKGEYEFQPLTVGQYFELCNKGLEEDETSGMAMQVVNHPFDQAVKDITSITGDDIAIVQDVDRYLYHGMKQMEVECKDEKCKKHALIDLEGDDTFIYPFRQSSESERDAIRFGVSRDS